MFRIRRKERPPQIQRTLGSPATLRSWAAVDVSQLQTVIASHFKRDYRAILSAPALPSAAPDGQLRITN